MDDLTHKRCVPCEVGSTPMKGTTLATYAKALGGEWKVVNEHHLEREFKFKNFAQALAFVNKVGALAEGEGHHPDIELGWGRVKISLWTHKINGLSENDFILAAKCNLL